ncbi:major facilitator superfamily domain-containing protein [Gongronella butleri]|nr:major facilitator superfamily domain-containing protein [Gongronella butleri]
MTFTLNMDRTNLSNAISDDMASDLGFDNDGISRSIMIYSVVFTLVTIPSNIIVNKYVGAHVWIPFLMTSWADYRSFLVVRVGIALFESGFIPACLVYMNAWYRTNELATRLAYFWGVQAVASAFSNVLASFVFHWSDSLPLQGWRVLFIVDGIFTHIIGLIAFFYLPSRPSSATTWLTSRERDIAELRVVQDDAIKKDQYKPLTRSDMYDALTDINVYIHLLITFIGLMPAIPIHLFLPTTIKAYGFSTSQANMLASPSSLIGFVFSVWTATHADKHGQVALHGLAGTLWGLTGFIAMVVIPENADKWLLYVATIFTASMPSWHGLQVAWMSSNLGPFGKRTIALAAVISAANINGVPGALIYQESDAPRYQHGNRICVALHLVTAFLWLLQRTRYKRLNCARQAVWDAMTDAERLHYMETTQDRGNHRLDHRYRL